MFELNGKRIYVAGHGGMVGSALVRQLEARGIAPLTAPRSLDLREQANVRAWFAANNPDAVIVAAAKVGGILANRDHPAQFAYDNLMIAANVIEAARQSGVAKLLFLGSSAVYPRDAAQPMAEEALLTGPLEPTHEGYAIAKIAGAKLCAAYRAEYDCDFIAALPTNLYGPGDSFDPLASHVVPGLIRKAHEAKLAGAESLTIWGSGSPRREFLHVDDCAAGCLFLLEHYSDRTAINLGSGSDVTIFELVEAICKVVGYDGVIERDTSKPDGPPRKLMDGSRLAALGWKPQIALEDGLAQTYRWFLDNVPETAA